MTAKKPKPESFRQVGTPSWKFSRLTTDKLTFVAKTSCLCCGRPMVVQHGRLAPIFRVGQEYVGVSCDACLSPEALTRLTHMRREKA
jgi:hypothetical protein